MLCPRCNSTITQEVKCLECGWQPTAALQSALVDFANWLINYETDYQQTVLAILSTWPGAEELTELGFAVKTSLDWKIWELLTRLWQACQDEEDVKFVIACLLAEDMEEIMTILAEPQPKVELKQDD